VYSDSALSLREFEAARISMAQINDCLLCQNWRSARDVKSRADEADTIDEEFYAHLLGDLSWDGFSERERLAAEFAQRYAEDHVNMDDDLWNRMHANYSDDEIVDLAVCVGSWLAYGRFNRVFDIDGGCRIPQH
jgi:alkylhydroperoxidase family enzyme